MPNIKLDFNWKSFTGTTPKPIKLTYQTIMLLSGLWVMVLQPNFNFSEHLDLIVTKIIASTNSGIYFFCQFFHWKMDQDNNGTSNT